MACRSVVVDGRQVNYLVAGKPDSKRYHDVLLDLGGPGLAVFGQGWPGSSLTEVTGAFPSATVIALEEPWVTAPVSGPCTAALSQEFREQHSGYPGSGSESVREHCRLFEGRYGWQADHYAKAVATVNEAERVSLDTFVGYSFGARRLDYAAPTLSTSILISPAPRELDASHFLGTRSEGVYASFAASAGIDIPTAKRAALTWASFRPREIPGRSVAVNSQDLAAAAATLPYLQGDIRATLARVLAHPEQSSTEQLTLIGQAADSAWQRMGVYDVSPARLAYLDEVCQAYPGWPASTPVGERDPVLSFLVHSHRPCVGAPVVPWRDGPGAAPAAACVVASRTDGVAPPAFARTWRRMARLVWRNEPIHGSGAWISDCA